MNTAGGAAGGGRALASGRRLEPLLCAYLFRFFFAIFGFMRVSSFELLLYNVFICSLHANHNVF